MQFTLNGMMVQFVQGDITELSTDAITNAANSELVLGAGVAGAIARKGGPAIQQECDRIGHCPVGSAVITGGGKLKAKYVIHAVGPRWGEGHERSKLGGAIRSALRLAEENRLNSMALPAISTGIFGFPVGQAAEIMASEIIDFAFEARSFLNQIVVCLYDTPTYQIFVAAFSEAIDRMDEVNKDRTILMDDDDYPG